MLGTGVEPARAINAEDFKSSVSTIPPSEQDINSQKLLQIHVLLKKVRVY